MMEAKQPIIRCPEKISQQFLFYLEKHRIFELFQELSTMLLIKKPDDHVLFLKQSLYHAAKRLDVPRIIILAPPEFDKLQLGCDLETKLDIPLITLNDIAGFDDTKSIIDSKCIVENLRMTVMSFMKKNCDGWILVDFPRTEEEARFIQRAGIIPSHVIDVTLSNTSCDLSKSREKLSKVNYCKNIGGIRRIFSKYLTKINVKDKSIEDITDECLCIVKRRNIPRGPTIFRIVLIDTVDTARCECLGRQLAEVFDIVHVDFNEVVEKIILQDSEVGRILRAAKKKTKYNFLLPTEIKIQVFENFLCQSKALIRGWVLTGFPTSVADFKSLDKTDNRPNRVLIIVAKNRTASEETVQNNTECECACDESGTKSSTKSSTEKNSDNQCPLSKSDQPPIDEETMKDIFEYVGETVTVFEEHTNFKKMKEKIEYSLMKAPLSVPPRVPSPPPEVKPEDIEFDPDDEPNIEVFDNIRAPEPLLPLV